MTDNRADQSLAAAAVNLVTEYISKKGAELTPTDVKTLLVDVLMGIRTASVQPLPDVPALGELGTASPQAVEQPSSAPAQVVETVAPAAAAPVQPAAPEEAKAAPQPEAPPAKTATRPAATKSTTPAPAKSAAETKAVAQKPANKSSSAAAPKTVEQTAVSEAAPQAAAEAAPELPLSDGQGGKQPAKSKAKSPAPAKAETAASEPAKPEIIKPVKMTVNERKQFAKAAPEQPEAKTKAALDKKFGRRIDVSRIPFEGLTPEEALTKKPGYVLSLFDGAGRKMISRYLRSEFGMTEDEYRLWWGLPSDYPMTSPGYSGEKSDYAKEVGLGTSAFIEKARAKKGEADAPAEAAEPAKAAKAAQETVAQQPTPKSERVVRSRPQPAAQKKKAKQTA